MTPEMKAKELIDMFIQNLSNDCDHMAYCTDKECQHDGSVVCVVKQDDALKCAILYCNGILGFMEEDDNKTDTVGWLNSKEFDFWQQVKTILQTL